MSRLMQKVNAALETQDPERVAKLNAVKEQVQRGTYQVDAGKVAKPPPLLPQLKRARKGPFLFLNICVLWEIP